jgi:hypothetical protein
MCTPESSSSESLLLSKERAYDCALDILGAYKLTGNFHVNLEIVLRDLGVLDEVEFEITPKYPLSFGSECRQVTFRPKSGIPATRFAAIVRAINDRIGFVARPCVWAGLFHWIDRQPRGAPQTP